MTGRSSKSPGIPQSPQHLSAPPTAGTSGGSGAPGECGGSRTAGRHGARGASGATAASGAEPEAAVAAGSLLWHGAGLVRATAIDLAVLIGHLLLYPTGMLPEHLPDPYDASQGAQDAARAQGGSPGGRAAGAATFPASGSVQPPILLLHGFVDNRSAFTLLRRSLHRHGWTRIQAVNYSPLTPDLRTAAEQLGRHIERACAQSGHARVDIVAHSLGGLIARYYVQRLGGDAQVRTLVTLGTPHSGTRAVPALTPHPLARQMRPGSPVLTELAGPARGCRTRFVAFWSDLDQLMIPVSAARLEHPDLSVKNIKLSGIGHLSLPVHGTVAAEIRRELTTEGPQTAPADAA